MWWLSTKWSQRAEKFRTKRFKSWLDLRVPPAQAIRLSHRNIFIVPTRQGFGFVLILLLILIAGINYQNALAHALAFLMLGLFLVAMLQTHRNLAGLVLSQTVPVEGFVGQKISVAFQVQSDAGRVHDGLSFFCRMPGLFKALALIAMEPRFTARRPLSSGAGMRQAA